MTFRFAAAALFVAQPIFSQVGPPEQLLTEELRITSTDGTGPLSTIGNATVRPDAKELFVTQPLEYSILVFDTDTGEFLRSIDTGSSAAGIVTDPGAVGWIADTLYVIDPRLKRVSLFTPAGEQIDATRVDTPIHPEAPLASRPIGVTATGKVISEVPFPAPALSVGMATPSPWALLDRDGSVITELGVRDLRESTVVLATSQGRIVFEQPLTQRNHLALHPDGTSIAIVNQPAGSDAPGSYEVIRLEPDGTRIFARRFSYTPRRVSGVLARRVLEEHLQELRDRTTDGRILATLQQNITIPTVHPPVSDVTLGRDDTVWLRAPVEQSSNSDWLVLGPSGDPVARVNGPANLRLLFVDETTVWGAISEEAGPPSLIRFRIEPVRSRAASGSMDH